MLTVYKASAGSGKTYTLAYEYIKLVLGYKDHNTGKYRLNKNPQEEHQDVLAITFTNKATDEMKRRIIKELAIIAELPAMGGEKSPYLKDLLSLFECTKDELKATAETVLGQLLFDYTFFNVSTIDAFFQNVLRTFAFEADLTGNYEVELDDSFAISSGVNELFNAINYRNDSRSKLLAEWLRQFMMQKIEEGGSFNLFNRKSQIYGDLLRFIKKLSDEQFKLRLNNDVESYFDDPTRIVRFEEQLKKQIGVTRNVIKNTAENIFKLLSEDDVAGMQHHVKTPIIKWQDILNQKIDDIDLSNTIKGVANHEKPIFKKGYIVSQEVEEAVQSAIERIVELIPRLKFLALIRKNIYGLGLIGDTMRFIKEFRENNNLILLSDTNDLLQRIISEDEAPFIYERMGVRLNHFLIDEFQDTSRLQWQNINPLVSESLSQDNDNLIIGDVKQCIYRFRNSDPSLLQNQVANDFTGQINERGVDVKENTNWRSSAEVVKFNNTLFSALSYILDVEDEYSNITQQVSEKHENHRGYVKFEFIDDDDDKKLKSFEKMAVDIKRQLDSGYQQKDIAILVRNGNDGESAINYLMDLMVDPEVDFPKINIISDGALKVDSSPMVKLIISVLRLLSSDIEGGSRYMSKRRFNQILHSYVLYTNRGVEPNEALNKAINGDSSDVDKLIDEVEQIEHVSLPTLVERIIVRYIPEDLRMRDIAFITAFQDEVLDFCSRGSHDVNSFLRWWDSSSSHYLASSTDVDAIRVMTIHKSKGLEFKCVHIPIANWPITDDPKKADYRWFDSVAIDGIDGELIPPVFALKNTKSLEDTPLKYQYEQNLRAEKVDTINVTYVAFTRAIDELCVNCMVTGKTEKNSISTAIYEAFEVASPDYCASLTEYHSGAKGELYIPLNSADKKSVFEIGEPTVAQKDEEKKIPPAEVVFEREASPYISADRDDLWKLTEMEDDGQIEDAKNRGVFLHRVMEHVYHLSDLQLALKRQGYRNNISDQELDEMYVMLSRAFSDERVLKWFEGYSKVVNERSICLKKDAKHTRPDRIVWTAEGTIDVVDYKFGEESEDYKDQVKEYMKHLIDMGHENVRGFLWYVDKGKILEVK